VNMAGEEHVTFFGVQLAYELQCLTTGQSSLVFIWNGIIALCCVLDVCTCADDVHPPPSPG
jgi:hypothetical protein